MREMTIKNERVCERVLEIECVKERERERARV